MCLKDAGGGGGEGVQGGGMIWSDVYYIFTKF